MRVFLLILIACVSASAQQASAPASDNELRYVLVFSRHGVRSPTGKNSTLNAYSSAPWPKWSVPPGYLTAHGYELMRLFGAYDRAFFARQRLLSADGCADQSYVTFVADSDQRARESGRALSEGMFPGCAADVHARAEGVDDPLFHSRIEDASAEERAIAVAAIAGRIGGDPRNVTEAYRPQLQALGRILAGCGKLAAANNGRTSVFDVPAVLEPGSGDHLATMRGPVNTASTLSENLLLEYGEGMQGTDFGWGCMDEAELRMVLDLHTAAADFTERTPAIARVLAARQMQAISASIEQAASGKPVAGAPGGPKDRLLFLVGHDTNIVAIAGALHLTWIVDGRRDDTPPGGALLFELWRSRSTGALSIGVAYTAQSLAQMHDTTPLTMDHPPLVVPVFVPGCGRQDGLCGLAEFQQVLSK